MLVLKILILPIMLFPSATNVSRIDGNMIIGMFFQKVFYLQVMFMLFVMEVQMIAIQAECDQNHTYLSNGDDGFCLVEVVLNLLLIY